MAVDTELAVAPWSTHLGEKHALVGQIYDRKLGRRVSPAEVEARLRAAKFVVLGEKHDNPDHHRIEAALLRVATEGRKGALVAEMITVDKQAALDGLAGRPTPEQLALAVDWDHTGWPPFAGYRPVFAAALESRMPIFAGDMPRATAHEVAHHGVAALDPALAQRHRLATPLPADTEARFEKEVADVHCGVLPPPMLPAMVLAQRARDAYLAEAMLSAREKTKADVTVLVSGDGHARDDRAVPALLESSGVPAGEVLSVGILEVDDSWTQPTDYAQEFHAARLPFDLVWFTPRANDDDPCAKMVSPKKP